MWMRLGGCGPALGHNTWGWGLARHGVVTFLLQIFFHLLSSNLLSTCQLSAVSLKLHLPSVQDWFTIIMKTVSEVTRWKLWSSISTKMCRSMCAVIMMFVRIRIEFELFYKMLIILVLLWIPWTLVTLMLTVLPSGWLKQLFWTIYFQTYYHIFICFQWFW